MTVGYDACSFCDGYKCTLKFSYCYGSWTTKKIIY